jgi:hypothetical protein
MEELLNPYTPGAGTRPRELAGRRGEIKAFDLLLGRLARGYSERSMVINGLRGVGKTVLVSEFEERAVEQGWGVGKLEVKSTTDFRADMADMARSALRQVSHSAKAKDALLKAARVLRAFTLSTNDHGGVDFSADFEAALGVAAGRDLERDLIELLVEVGIAAQANGAGVVFFIDEMQLLAKTDLEALCAALHRVGQKALPVAIVGAGLPVLPELLAEAKSYAERLFTYPALGRLPQPAARQAIERPPKTVFDDRDIVYEPEAVDAIIASSECYPYFLQAYGKHAWNAAPDDGEVIRLQDVETAQPLALAELDRDFFENRFARATTKGKRYLAAMADLGTGPYSSSAVAAAGGWKSIQSAGPVRQTLIDKGLIYAPDHGLIDYTVPHFADFMTRKHPLSSM